MRSRLLNRQLLLEAHHGVRHLHRGRHHHRPHHRSHASPSTSGSRTRSPSPRRRRRSGSTSSPLGQHHNPPFVASAPTTTMAYIGAQTERIKLSTSTTLITTTDPVRIAEDYATLQHLLDGRMDLMLGRGNTGPVYPWFGKDIRDGIPLAIENYALLRRLWREENVDWEGKYRTPLQGFTSTPASPRRRAAVRLARLDPQPRDRRAGGVLRRRVLLQPHLLAGLAHRADGRVLPPALRALRPRQGRGRHRRPGRAGLPGAHARAGGPGVPSRTSTTRPVYGHGPSLEEFTSETPLTVGTPAGGRRAHPLLQGVRRQLPAPAVPRRPRRPAADARSCNQLDLLGEVVAELRKHDDGGGGMKLARRLRGRCRRTPHRGRDRRPVRAVLDAAARRPARRGHQDRPRGGWPDGRDRGHRAATAGPRDHRRAADGVPHR